MDDEPDVEPWECPECDRMNTVRIETEVGCDQCGEHPALQCEHCGDIIDLIYWNV